MMTKPQCKHPKTEFERRMYGMCGVCWLKVPKPRELPGQWSRRTKSELNAYSKDTLQPTNKDGTVNKKYVQAYGTKTLEREWKTDKKTIEKITY